MIVLPPEVGVGLGLGEMFQAVPFRTTVHRLDLTTSEGAMRLHVVKYETPLGAKGYVYDDAALAVARDQLIEASTGIIIATNNKEMFNHDHH